MVVMHAGPGRRWVEQDSRVRGVYSRIRTKLGLNRKATLAVGWREQQRAMTKQNRVKEGRPEEGARSFTRCNSNQGHRNNRKRKRMTREE